MSQAKLVMLLGFWREKDRLCDVTVLLLLLIGCWLNLHLAWPFGLELTVLSVLLTKSPLTARQCASRIPNHFPLLCKAAVVDCRVSRQVTGVGSFDRGQPSGVVRCDCDVSQVL